jgi:membrane carboxypeptidase/penicillin-binding protein
MIVVLENKTGRILAMSGGFSYPLSQLNRATQSVRQPGSAIKPLSYLAALGKGLQPNTLVSDAAITFPPIKKGRAREQDYWTPKNYDGTEGGTLTLRRALENSRNLATAHLLKGGIEDKPEASLERLCQLALEAQIYRECLHLYPFVLGAEPVRPVDLAAFYATIANEGLRPSPHVIDFIERNGAVVYRRDPSPGMRIASVDEAAFYQLKSMMQGVVARGTARAIADLSPYVAGKTGTSDDANDAWFVGFTNEVTVAVWIGYDNADSRRRTLGSGATGGGIAVPIFAPVIRAAWADISARTALTPPSAEARRHLSCTSIDLDSGEIQEQRSTRNHRVLPRGPQGQDHRHKGSFGSGREPGSSWKRTDAHIRGPTCNWTIRSLAVWRRAIWHDAVCRAVRRAALWGASTRGATVRARRRSVERVGPRMCASVRFHELPGSRPLPNDPWSRRSDAR